METMLQIFLTYVLNESLQSVLIVRWVCLGHDGYFVVRTPKYTGADKSLAQPD